MRQIAITSISNQTSSKTTQHSRECKNRTMTFNLINHNFKTNWHSLLMDNGLNFIPMRDGNMGRFLPAPIQFWEHYPNPKYNFNPKPIFNSNPDHKPKHDLIMLITKKYKAILSCTRCYLFKLLLLFYFLSN